MSDVSENPSDPVTSRDSALLKKVFLAGMFAGLILAIVLDRWAQALGTFLAVVFP